MPFEKAVKGSYFMGDYAVGAETKLKVTHASCSSKLQPYKT